MSNERCSSRWTREKLVSDLGDKYWDCLVLRLVVYLVTQKLKELQLRETPDWLLQGTFILALGVDANTHAIDLAWAHVYDVASEWWLYRVVRLGEANDVSLSFGESIACL